LSELIRWGKPDPQVRGWTDDDGMRHIEFPWMSRHLMTFPYSGFQIITYHPYAGEVWLFDLRLSEMDDWNSTILLAMTLKEDFEPSIRIRGSNMRDKNSENWQRFNFEVILEEVGT
jgi:hypothetical protein